MKRTSILWIVVLVLGWCFDFLFWKQGQGINIAIYVALCLAGAFMVLRLNGIRPSWKSLLLLIPILFFAAITFIRQEQMSLFLSFALTLGLMGLLAVSFLGGRWMWYGLSDYVFNYAKLIGSMLARPLTFLSETRKAAAAGQANGQAAGPRPDRPGLETLLGHFPWGIDRSANFSGLCGVVEFRRPGLRPAPERLYQIIPAGKTAGIYFPGCLYPDRGICAGWRFPACRPQEPGRETAERKAARSAVPGFHRGGRRAGGSRGCCF